MFLEAEIIVQVPTVIIQDKQRLEDVKEGVRKSMIKGLYEEGFEFEVKKLNFKIKAAIAQEARGGLTPSTEGYRLISPENRARIFPSSAQENKKVYPFTAGILSFYQIRTQYYIVG